MRIMTLSNVRKNVFCFFLPLFLRKLTNLYKDIRYKVFLLAQLVRVASNSTPPTTAIWILLPYICQDSRWQCSLLPQHPAERFLSSRMLQMEIKRYFMTAPTTISVCIGAVKWAQNASYNWAASLLTSVCLFMNVQRRKWKKVILGRDRAGFPLFIHLSSSFSLSPCCHLPAVILCFTALTTIPFPLIKKTDMPHWQHNVSPAFSRPPDRHAERPITGRRRTIIQIIRPITAHGWRLMRAPANLEADRASGGAMWRKRRRTFVRVVDRPEMRLTNEQRWFLIRLMCVLATEVCLIESGLKEAFDVFFLLLLFI